MNEIERVFYHELGHYTAQELNRRYYNGTGVNEILIYPCAKDETKFCGHTQPKLPEGYDGKIKKPPPIHRLAEYLASLVYGCFFQCYWQNISISDCFNTYGNDDTNYWLGAIRGNNMVSTNKYFAAIDEEYYRKLVKNRDLDRFFSLRPADYLVETQPRHYQVNLAKLDKDANETIVAHHEHYKMLINSYGSVIQSHSNYYWLTFLIGQLLSRET